MCKSNHNFVLRKYVVVLQVWDLDENEEWKCTASWKVNYPAQKMLSAYYVCCIYSKTCAGLQIRGGKGY